MDISLIETLVALLTVSVLLNYTLTFRLFAIIKTLPPSEPPFPPLEQGDTVPYLEGKMLAPKSTAVLPEQQNQPRVVVFVSAGCPTCKSKLPEIKALLPAMKEAGVGLWVVCLSRPWRAKLFLRKSGLVTHALTLERHVRKQLNPTHASPYYQFIDEHAVLQASGFLGDENWLTFVSQMQEEE